MLFFCFLPLFYVCLFFFAGAFFALSPGLRLCCVGCLPWCVCVCPVRLAAFGRFAVYGSAVVLSWTGYAGRMALRMWWGGVLSCRFFVKGVAGI